MQGLTVKHQWAEKVTMSLQTCIKAIMIDLFLHQLVQGGERKINRLWPESMDWAVLQKMHWSITHIGLASKRQQWGNCWKQHIDKGGSLTVGLTYWSGVVQGHGIVKGFHKWQSVFFDGSDLSLVQNPGADGQKFLALMPKNPGADERISLNG